MGRLAGLTEQTPGDLALDRFHPLPRPSVSYVICGADYCSRLDPTCENASPNGGIRTSTCPPAQSRGTRINVKVVRDAQIMTASSPDSRACRCLRPPGGGCRTWSSYGSRLEALPSDTDSSVPSSCVAGHPSEP